jgi:hypothetical protein
MPQTRSSKGKNNPSADTSPKGSGVSKAARVRETMQDLHQQWVDLDANSNEEDDVPRASAVELTGKVSKRFDLVTRPLVKRMCCL